MPPAPTAYVVTVTATDQSAGTSATQTFYWTVNPPVVTVSNPGDQSNSGGDTVSLMLMATSSDNAPLAYSVAGLPPGLAIDSNTGLISGNFQSEAAGSYAVTVTVTDPSSGVSVAVTFNWDVVS